MYPRIKLAMGRKWILKIDTSTGWTFIQRVGYEGATTRTLPVPLTFLVFTDNNMLIC